MVTSVLGVFAFLSPLDKIMCITRLEETVPLSTTDTDKMSALVATPSCTAKKVYSALRRFLWPLQSGLCLVRHASCRDK